MFMVHYTNYLLQSCCKNNKAELNKFINKAHYKHLPKVIVFICL